ncbi:MAG: DUF3098 domain-containing protein [Saprospiraceae bacterium]|nr:DUF3098 domain-containing protein [Saprospiraceae bacterium]
MSQKKNSPKKKRIVKTKQEKKGSKKSSGGKAVRKRKKAPQQAELIFGRENYIWMGVGALLVALGLLLMSGGAMPNPDVWEPDRIYGFRRTTLAPIVILLGLGIEIYAIFKR